MDEPKLDMVAIGNLLAEAKLIIGAGVELHKMSTYSRLALRCRAQAWLEEANKLTPAKRCPS